MTTKDADEAINAALQDLARAYDATTEAIHGHPDASEAFRRSGDLVEALRQLYESSAVVRAKAANRIKEEEKMSIAGLANHISTSKARAAQLIRVATAADADQAQS